MSILHDVPVQLHLLHFLHQSEDSSFEVGLETNIVLKDQCFIHLHVHHLGKREREKHLVGRMGDGERGGYYIQRKKTFKNLLLETKVTDEKNMGHWCSEFQSEKVKLVLDL